MEVSEQSSANFSSTSTLGLSGEAPLKRHKSPGAAFAMSLVLPGSGQLYCGKNRGIATMVFFFVGVAIFFGAAAMGGENTLLLGVGIRLTMILYAFGFLDAYFTAREVNRDIDLQIDGTNPRVAAVLNLLTKGFGYFYLGHRGAGIAVFLLVSVLDGAVRAGSESTKLYVGVLSELVLGVLALHAWRMARNEVEPLIAEGEARIALEPQQELNKWLPICVSFFVGSIYLALIIVGVAMGGEGFKKIDPSTGKVSLSANGAAEYVNDAYGVTARVPNGWTITPGGDAHSFFEAKRADQVCSSMLMGDKELFHRPDDEVLMGELRKKYPNTKLAGMNPSRLGQLAANEVQFRIPVGEAEVLQRYVIARRGLQVYILIETLGLDECRADVDAIRQSVNLR